MINFFITATDTDAGKTFVSCALIKALVTKGKRVAAYKPISAGCSRQGDELVNEDAQLLANEANCQQTIDDINPISFFEPIAPHIAARKQNMSIELDQIFDGYQKLGLLSPDITITEGAGGWRLPLGNGHFLSDFAKQAKQQIILVVHMKLGCLNHAVLTYQAIKSDGLNCVAWVANCPEPMPYLDENIAELENLLPMPKLAQLIHCDFTQAAQQMNVELLDV